MPIMNMPRQPTTGSSIGNGRRQHAKLPAEPHVRGSPRAHRRRPRFGDQSHADAELAAEPDARQCPIEQKIVIAAREPAQPGEHGEYHDRIGQDADTSDLVGQHAEEDAADDSADQCCGDE
jgi:hypothetical protein